LTRDPYVDLDPAFYMLIGRFEPRFPVGAPSLRKAERFMVRGDVTFGAGSRFMAMSRLISRSG
jgi:UTP--glucose-1-phosphate uridylyltransferase